MGEVLRSVGLDVGTTTTQLILSELRVENRADPFAVPAMEITDRRVLYRSPILLTPLSGTLVDGAAIRAWVQAQYAQAGIEKSQVDTGAIIITGETSRKENAARVLEEISSFAGDFVVATAGPHLESVLAAKGAGADTYSEKTGKRVLHMDIGGGTSNLALCEDGKIVATGCLNVGGRLLQFDGAGHITYVSPVLAPISRLRVGECPTRQALEDLCQTLTQALEMAAGLRTATELLATLSTAEAGAPFSCPAPDTISFSGGVADCIENVWDMGEFGDIGPLLGQAIRRSRLCAGDYRLGAETIRATVIGAGCHSATLSGSTVLCRDVALPLKNLPVVAFTARQQESGDLPRLMAEALKHLDAPNAVIALPGYPSPTYAQVQALAQKLAEGLGSREAWICLEGDMAKALGQCLALLRPGRGVLCMDNLRLPPDSYLDVGAPVGPALPVVIKTLILSKGSMN